MPAVQDEPINDDFLKGLLCDVEMPFPMTLQEQFQLFSLLDNAVFAVRSGFADLFDIPPTAYPALEALHGKFIRSFHGGGVPDGCRPVSPTYQ